ncbi:MAG TPA: UDP-N-acetylmuramate dehydrogenase [Planctomycetota bacterium]|nr:UDP-N-acetylmuramate dehydrogenase [Planctomycetota bacterium]
MSFSSDFDDIVTRGFPLGKATTFGIGGPAEMLARPRSAEELGRLLAAAGAEGLPVRLLGGGSNLLVADEGVKGLVVRLAGKAFASLEQAPAGLSAGAGVPLARLVREAASAGLSGVENLAGIPGSVGGALVMNAGGKYGYIGDVVEEVRALESSGRPLVLGRAECGFGYRSSKLRGLTVTGARLALTPDRPEAVAERTRKVRAEKRRAQPMNRPSAGCVFKNPRPDLPAGRLIDELGFKGRRVGGAAVSDLHANYIVNLGGARCAEVLELIAAIREAASRERGIGLELEVEIWS